MSTLAEEKKALRQHVRALKRTFTPQQLDEKSLAAVTRLKALKAFRDAKTVMLYYSLPDEVNTHTLVVEMAKEKHVILPTVVGDDIIPVEFRPETQMREGDFHILEPEADRYDGSYDLIVVPGMAFDADGHRLGRGKGYYDRFLEQHPEVPTIGLCFDFQLMEHVPAESFDKPMNLVLYNEQQ